MSISIPAKALLLDMDGTLVDSTAAVERIWSDWAVAHGFDPVEVLPRIHGRQGQESMAELLPDRPMEENLRENAALLARETSEVEGVVAIRGAGEFLSSLSDVPHALVTSADLALARARMDAAGLTVPQLAITAERVSRSKPDPEGFLLGATLLGINPAECVAFEDSRAGITAAKAAGMRVIGVGSSTAQLGADWTIDDLSQVRVDFTNSDATLHLTTFEE